MRDLVIDFSISGFSLDPSQIKTCMELNDLTLVKERWVLDVRKYSFSQEKPTWMDEINDPLIVCRLVVPICSMTE